MAQFFVSMRGGAYCLVTAESATALADGFENAEGRGERFVNLERPDGRTVVIDPQTVTLIQPPAPAITKEN